MARHVVIRAVTCAAVVVAGLITTTPASAQGAASGYSDCGGKLLALRVSWQSGAGTVPLSVHVEGDAGSTTQTTPGPSPTTIVTWHRRGTWTVDTYPTGFLRSATAVCV